VASQIDPTKPADGVPAVKADLRTNLQAAKSEIEGLQGAVAGKAESGHVHALADGEVTASRDLVLADAQSRMLRVDAIDDVTLTIPPAAGTPFPDGTVIHVTRWGSGALTIAAANGVTLHHPADRGTGARAQYSVLGLWKQAGDVWLLYGDLT
jgi:hypothetical protein